jgi:Putative transposase
LLEIAVDPKHLGAEIGMISILHTWGQNLLLHPHIHCAIPARADSRRTIVAGSAHAILSSYP